jgi:hypothetical protein
LPECKKIFEKSAKNRNEEEQSGWRGKSTSRSNAILTLEVLTYTSTATDRHLVAQSLNSAQPCNRVQKTQRHGESTVRHCTEDKDEGVWERESFFLKLKSANCKQSSANVSAEGGWPNGPTKLLMKQQSTRRHHITLAGLVWRSPIKTNANDGADAQAKNTSTAPRFFALTVTRTPRDKINTNISINKICFLRSFLTE